MSNSLKTLIGKLNETSRAAATRAASICMSMGHYEVDIEHLFLALMEQESSDFVILSKHFDVGLNALDRDLRAELETFKNGNTRTPVFSQHIAKLLENAWLIASLETKGLQQIRSANLLLALLTDAELSQLAQRTSKLYRQYQVDEIKHHLDKLTKKSHERPQEKGHAEQADEKGDAVSELSQTAGKTPALDQFTNNLTQAAKDGKIDPVIGRDSEIRLAIDILMRRRQNNPILTGEAGVGKTAVAEGLALRIAQNDVPEVLQGVAIHALDMGLLQAGASVKGEFENRLKNVINEVKKSPHPIILFIDEAHTMIGAGGQAGQSDAANLLKPALARGELRTIAATTWAEYKKYFEKDAALARRFQVVKVDEPTETLACSMLRGMSGLMEKHFKVRIYDEAITEAVRLSNRYITGRQLPDKAISILDTACAKVALGQSTTPSLLESTSKQIERNAIEIKALENEETIGVVHKDRLKELNLQNKALIQEQKRLTTRWEKEQKCIQEITELRLSLEGGSTKSKTKGTTKKRNDTDKQLAKKEAELKKLQGETPLVASQVDGSVVAEIVSSWTGIPLGKMIADEINTTLNLDDLMEARVIGQPHAISAIAQRVRTSRANLDDPNKPKGVFMLVGPSGVGKTETALSLADILYGGEKKLVTINMSEYQEAHSVAGLKGSPPGYVGYGEGGVLTEAVRRNPYCVVLLDEVEKAHPDVMELFFQVFDKGVLDDAEGNEVDFKNTIIILTSNIGSAQMMQACLNKTPEEMPAPEALDQLIRPHLMQAFKPAFLGRLKVIPYYPLSDDILAEIIALKLDHIAARISSNHKAKFIYNDNLVEAILARCVEVDSGARNIDNIINGTILPEIADQVLKHMAAEKPINSIKVNATKTGKISYILK